jgi:hypothetical protein
MNTYIIADGVRSLKVCLFRRMDNPTARHKINLESILGIDRSARPPVIYNFNAAMPVKRATPELHRHAPASQKTAI